MKCPTCGHATSSRNARFCAECGTQFPLDQQPEVIVPVRQVKRTIDLAEPAVPVDARHPVSVGAPTAPAWAPPARPAAPAAPPEPPPVAEPPAAPAQATAWPWAPPPEPPAPPPFPAPPARAPAARRSLFWILVGAMALVSLVLGLAALGGQKERGSAIGLLVAAGVVAIAPIVLTLVHHTPSAAVRVPLAAVFAASLVALGIPVFQTSCTERLGAGANLKSCNFASADLAGRNLRDANLSGATLTGATLRSTDLRGANLNGAKLNRADATSATFDGADLTGAVFDDAKLGEASFENAVLRDTSLRRTVLEGAVFGGTTLAGAAFDGAKMSGLQLKNADLSGASLVQTTLTGAVLDGANLRGAKLDGAALAEASLVGANLDGASLKDATLNAAKLGGASLRRATLDGARLPGALLSGAALDNASLRGVDLSGTSLNDVSFTGAVLANVRLDDATLIGATGLSDATLAKGVGIGTVALGPYLSARSIRLESRDRILSSLGSACRGGGPGLGRSGTFHPLVLLNANGGTSAWTPEAAALGWEPMAARFGQLVGCVQESQVTVQRCLYTEIGGLGRTGSITRYRNVLRVRVVDAKSGSAVFDRTYQGSQPELCPTVTSYQANGRIDGSEIDFSTVKPALTNLVGRVPTAA